MSQRSEDAVAARLELAVSAARAAGEITLQFFQRDEVQVERKSDNSPVTQADRQAEQLLRRLIGESYPQDAIVGEEYGEVEGSSGYTWILDPIDGTKSFISGVPLYSVLIGIVSGGESLAGVILLPALQECVYAARGQGAWWVRQGDAPRPAKVSTASSLGEGLFVTSQVDSFEKRGAAAAYHQLERAASITRSWGDGYGYLLVATGRALAMVDPIMNLWDAASLQPILKEAGGAFTDWSGRDTIYGGEGIGTNGRVLAEVLSITRPFARPAS